MLKNYKLLVFIISFCLSSSIGFAQSEEYKDVLLDGKPAKLNLKTGEITLVKKLADTKVDASEIKVKAESEKSKSTQSNNEADSNNNEFHIVKSNERLTTIAKQYNISLVKLMEANKLETTLISKGQKLRVRDFSENKNHKNQTSNSVESAKVNSDFHLVTKGQTLYSISKIYGYSVNELKSFNNLNSNLIKEGQRLRITKPLPSTIQHSSDVWIVVKGDTLYSISKRTSTTVNALKQINNLTSNLIFIGQKLRLK
ncbi:LysM peptidoglycan-binding domain-containing protein [Ichthyenterobacterium sp. W332]|uniref:LysM peptidoglycan-binding domain-containing protein n=1 Tax=Microcosmobacter mediterraneus TaxID=3075607 RepID=A0ABU2YJ03_9FLAO|nr:LysM peptidoglycan-binding domain-containing protein [Ichthyenterobacterium sp. W332]MDT0557654.1 LysM peptidoglycan-binding domain-containing protein [Ichthyenterobacterium sp. W332]